MNKVSTFLRESFRELTEKVTWPTWPQLQSSTTVVMIATLIIIGVVWLMDMGTNSLLKFIYSVFK